MIPVGQWIGLAAAVGLAGSMLAAAFGGAPDPQGKPAIPAEPKPFVVFDATLYKDKPDLRPFRVRPLAILYAQEGLPPESLVRVLADGWKNSSDPVVIDIERWPLKGDAPTVQATVRQFRSVLAWFKDTAPAVRVGLYGTVPLPDYWRAVRPPGTADYRAWQEENDRLGAIVSDVDALFPSLYTFYPDRRGWVTYAVAQMREAKRLARGKPVYAFLWPQYHESNALLSHRPLDPDYWTLQLKTVYEHADGVGERGPEPWKETAPWWQATKRFLSDIDRTTGESSTDSAAR
jgi:hypothetical protein